MHSPGYVGKLFAKKNEEEGEKEAKELPEFFKLFKDFVFSVALFMIVLFYVVTIACLVTGHFGDTLANNKPFTSYFGNDTVVDLAIPCWSSVCCWYVRSCLRRPSVHR